MSRTKKIVLSAVLTFTVGFTVVVVHHNHKPCKVVWSEYTNTPGACAE